MAGWINQGRIALVSDAGLYSVREHGQVVPEYDEDERGESQDKRV